MTNIQKAIKFAENEIKSLELAPEINGCEMTEWWKEQIEVWKNAISALEKQIPKKVVKHNGSELYHCPNCDTYFLGSGFKHCTDCGQALDWSDTE